MPFSSNIYKHNHKLLPLLLQSELEGPAKASLSGRQRI